MEIRYDDLKKKLDGLQLKQQQCAPTVQIKPKSTANTVLHQSTKLNRYQIHKVINETLKPWLPI